MPPRSHTGKTGHGEAATRNVAADHHRAYEQGARQGSGAAARVPTRTVQDVPTERAPAARRGSGAGIERLSREPKVDPRRLPSVDGMIVVGRCR